MGVVTSPAESPRVGPIGLAILDAAAAEDGTKVEVGGSVATVDAAVDPGPAEAAAARLTRGVARAGRRPALAYPAVT